METLPHQKLDNNSRIVLLGMIIYCGLIVFGLIEFNITEDSTFEIYTIIVGVFVLYLVWEFTK